METEYTELRKYLQGCKTLDNCQAYLSRVGSMVMHTCAAAIINDPQGIRPEYINALRTQWVCWRLHDSVADARQTIKTETWLPGLRKALWLENRKTQPRKGIVSALTVRIKALEADKS